MYTITHRTSNVPAVTSSLEAQGISCLVLNPGTCMASGEVEAELGFESQEQLEAAEKALGLVAA